MVSNSVGRRITTTEGLSETFKEIRALDELKELKKLAVKEMRKFWGYELKETPEVTYDTYCEENFNTNQIKISKKSLKVYGERPARLSNHPLRAGHLHYVGHAINHFFAYQENKELHTVLPSRSHLRPMVEAMMNTATTWLLDQKGYDGYKVSKAWYKSERQKPMRDTKSNRKSEKEFENFMNCIKPEGTYSPEGIKQFVNLVKNYSSE